MFARVIACDYNGAFLERCRESAKRRETARVANARAETRLETHDRRSAELRGYRVLQCPLARGRPLRRRLRAGRGVRGADDIAFDLTIGVWRTWAAGQNVTAADLDERRPRTRPTRRHGPRNASTPHHTCRHQTPPSSTDLASDKLHGKQYRISHYGSCSSPDHSQRAVPQRPDSPSPRPGRPSVHPRRTRCRLVSGHHLHRDR